MNKKTHTLRSLKNHKLKNGHQPLQMLTCYDFQTAQMLNETDLDMILVGDSLANVVLGLPTTVPVTLENMSLFGRAVTRGAPEKFVVIDLPFGSYSYYTKGIDSATEVFQQTQAQALKLEGASEESLKIILSLTQSGIPIMGHIGLTPQSVHQMGGYYTHGKEEKSIKKLKEQAKMLVEAGCFCLVLECVEKELAQEITREISIPTIGIGSGEKTDGQVLVINDLLHLGKDDPPSFCQPIDNLYQRKLEMINQYLNR